MFPHLAFRNQLPQIVVDELEQLVANLVEFLKVSHDEDGNIIDIDLDGIQDQIDAIIALLPHNLLSARHLDTVTNDPLPGALVVGSPQAGVTDLSPYWHDGLTIAPLPTSVSAGGNQFWRDGLPVSGALSSTGDVVKWVRKTIGPPGTVLVSTGNDLEWSTPSSSSLGASVQPNLNVAIPSATDTLIAFAAVDDDGGPFWDAGDPTKLTVPTGQGGAYLVVGQITWTDALGVFAVRLFKNGTQIAQSVLVNTVSGLASPIDLAHQASKRLILSEGDEITMKAYWTYTDTTARTVLANNHRTFLQIGRL